jgi:hypothetical protein
LLRKNVADACAECLDHALSEQSLLGSADRALCSKNPPIEVYCSSIYRFDGIA